MPQKILAGRAEDPLLGDELMRVRVDQLILAREPNAVLELAVARGFERTEVETALAYDTRCVTSGSAGELSASTPQQVAPDAPARGVAMARAGIGFPAAVHLERFAAPARLALTDDPRLLSMGGAGMLTLLGSRTQLAGALQDGTLALRSPRSLQVLLTGKLRPCVSVRDAALELVRRGVPDIIRALDSEHRAPVVLEFGGPGARLLSVPERALLCSLAPRLGAVAALFPSDEKTEAYLRDQRRSKAHRALVPDAGAPYDHVLTLDLSVIDPLLLDAAGVVRPVRELEGEPLQQVVLGGDIGAPLKDMLTVAARLESKRVPAELELLVACASRQVLEVLAESQALSDLIATGARLVEPDYRVLSGELYTPAAANRSLRTYDAEPGSPGANAIVASAETLAYSVAAGHVGDPRGFKRPVRVTVPRLLPTEEVLVVRKPRTKAKQHAVAAKPTPGRAAEQPTWSPDLALALTRATALPREPAAGLAGSLDDLRWFVANAAAAPMLRVVVASFVPSGWVTLLSAGGVLALEADDSQLAILRGARQLVLAGPERWGERIPLSVDGVTLELLCTASAEERSWTTNGAPHAAEPGDTRT